MGVHGLWQLLQPTGRPVTLESLEGKILAVDVSIWLNQTIKGMRDRHGNPLPNAHLLGLFHRVCKLLHYRIKPIFVFDGGVPALKRHTLNERRRRKEALEDKSSKAAKKLLTNVLKHHAVSTVIGETSNISLPAPKPSTSRETDMYELPPLPEQQSNDIDEVEESWEDWMAQRDTIYEEFQDLNGVDIGSEDFKALPPEIQHEILSELKDKQKKNIWAKLDELPEDANDFARYQLSKILKQSVLSQKLDNVHKEMNTRSSGDIISNWQAEENAEQHITSKRIMSEDSSHLLLIKRTQIKNKNSPNKALPQLVNPGVDVKDDLKNVQIGTTDEKYNESNINANAKNALTKVSVDDLIDISGGKNKYDVAERQKNEIVPKDTIDLTEETSTPVDKLSDIAGGFIRDESDGSQSETDSCIKQDTFKNNGTLSKSVGETGSVIYPSNRSTSKIHEERAEVAGTSEGVSELNVENNSTAQQSEAQVPTDMKDDRKYSGISKQIEAEFDRNGEMSVSKDQLQNITDDESDDENDFIEVVTNPLQDKEEELFPASVFLASVNPTEVLKAGDESVEAVDTTETSEITQEDANNIIISDDNHSEPAEIPDAPTDFMPMSQNDLEEMRENIEQEQKSLEAERKKHERFATSVTDQMQAEAMELLRLFGVPFLESPMEAEAQCAQLELNGQTEGTITDDSDIWLFGGTRVYKNIFNQTKYVELYKADDIRTQLTLDRNRMINIALLCGSDYTEGVKGVGPITAMEIFSEFKGTGLELLHTFKDWWTETQKHAKVLQATKVKTKLRHLELNSGFPSQRVVDAYLEPTVDESKDVFSWGMPNLDLIREYALEKFGWIRNKTDEKMLPILKQLNKSESQSHITRFFNADFEANKQVPSKRLKRVLNRLNSVSTEKPSKCKKGKHTEEDVMKARKTKAKKVLQTEGGKGRGRHRKGGKARPVSPMTVNKPQTEKSYLSESSSE